MWRVCDTVLLIPRFLPGEKPQKKKCKPPTRSPASSHAPALPPESPLYMQKEAPSPGANPSPDSVGFNSNSLAQHPRPFSPTDAMLGLPVVISNHKYDSKTPY